jgi:hypothetical protein
MNRTLTDEDIEAIAKRVVQELGRRLTLEERSPEAAASSPQPDATKTLSPKLAFTLKELCAELSISKVTVYRLEIRGLIKPVPGIRHKLYSRVDVERFLAGKHPCWR